MKNQFFKRFISTVKIRVKGRNIERFLHRLVHEHIDLLEVKNIRYNEVLIWVKKSDLERIYEIKTIYEVTEEDQYGRIRVQNHLYRNRILIGCIMIGICTLYFLSHVMFQIEVVHNDRELREMLLSELKEVGVAPKHLRKNYEELQKIKKDILEKHKMELEWLEIEVVGTKYIVRVEERKMNDKEEEIPIRNVVSKKHATIKKIIAYQGDVVKELNSYVKPGDVIISGDIKLNEESKNKTGADGEVYGEVWYETQVSLPYEIHEKHATGKRKTVYSFKFLNHRFEFFNFEPFKQVERKETILLGHPFLPISFVKEEQREVIRKDVVYTEEEALNEAIKIARKKIEDGLSEKEYIISQKNLKVDMRNSKIVVDVFFSVYENITDYRDIPKEEEQPKEE